MEKNRTSKRENSLLGKLGATTSISFASSQFGVSKQKTSYHVIKFVDPGLYSFAYLNDNLGYRCQPHGGLTYQMGKKLNEGKIFRHGPLYSVLSALLWWKCQQNPATRLSEYRLLVKQKLDLAVSKSTLARIFKGWNWSWKVPCFSQILKFTPQNMDYYGDFIYWLSTTDPTKCKFADESHFTSRSLHRSRALSPRGDPINLVQIMSPSKYILMLLGSFWGSEPISDADTLDRLFIWWLFLLSIPK